MNHFPFVPEPPSNEAWLAELAQIQAESIGWLPWEEGAYWHAGSPDASVVVVVGVPDATLSHANLLLIS
jgi:hypothetical protein